MGVEHGIVRKSRCLVHLRGRPARPGQGERAQLPARQPRPRQRDREADQGEARRRRRRSDAEVDLTVGRVRGATSDSTAGAGRTPSMGQRSPETARHPGRSAGRRVPTPDPVEVARAICLRQLTAGPRTRAQLADGAGRQAACRPRRPRVLDRFTEVGLIDDAAFAEAWVESRHPGRGLAAGARARAAHARASSPPTATAALATVDAEPRRPLPAAGRPQAGPDAAVSSRRRGPSAGRDAGPQGLSGRAGLGSFAKRWPPTRRGRTTPARPLAGGARRLSHDRDRNHVGRGCGGVCLARPAYPSPSLQLTQDQHHVQHLRTTTRLTDRETVARTRYPPAKPAVGSSRRDGKRSYACGRCARRAHAMPSGVLSVRPVAAPARRRRRGVGDHVEPASPTSRSSWPSRSSCRGPGHGRAGSVVQHRRRNGTAPLAAAGSRRGPRRAPRWCRRPAPRSTRWRHSAADGRRLRTQAAAAPHRRSCAEQAIAAERNVARAAGPGRRRERAWRRRASRSASSSLDARAPRAAGRRRGSSGSAAERQRLRDEAAAAGRREPRATEARTRTWPAWRRRWPTARPRSAAAEERAARVARAGRRPDRRRGPRRARRRDRDAGQAATPRCWSATSSATRRGDGRGAGPAASSSTRSSGSPASRPRSACVSVLHLPSDEMKGRIIGREGRNIRAFESVTGVNLIIDDTPEAVLLSCFDPVRREVGRLTLEKLVLDGRIHPHRIEEVYERARRPRSSGCASARPRTRWSRSGITDLHPELVDAARPAALPHVVRPERAQAPGRDARTSPGIMAAELRPGRAADQAVRVPARHRQGAHPRGRGQPRARSAPSVARKYGEIDEVVHAIEAHHNEVEPQTVEAVLTQAADACSGGRPGARRECLEAYVKRLRAASRRSPAARRASRRSSRCRPAGRSGSWSCPTTSTTSARRCSPATSPSRSRRS